MVYNHPWDTFTAALLAHASVYWFIGYGLQSYMGCDYFCTTCACIGLLGTVYNHQWDTSIAHMSIYWVRSIIHGMRLPIFAPLVYILVYQFGLRSSIFFCTAGIYIGLFVLVYNQSRDASTSALLVGCMGPSVLVYNHLREAITAASPGHVLIYLGRFTIILWPPSSFDLYLAPISALSLPIIPLSDLCSPKIALVFLQDCGLLRTFIYFRNCIEGTFTAKLQSCWSILAPGLIERVTWAKLTFGQPFYGIIIFSQMV